MTHLFLINPAAGSHDATKAYEKAIRETLEGTGIDYRIHVSEAPGDCAAIARKAAQTGEDYRIYACGGDGTLNEVVSGVVGYDNVAVTMFAGGSGNDFVRIFSETEPFRHLDRLLEAKEAEFDLIRCNEDVSLNICSVGLDARIGTDVSHYKRLPLLTGFRAYAVSALINTIRGVTEHYVVEIDGQTVDARQTLICVCNGRYYGGGFNPVPEADPADGKLDVLLVKGVSRLQVMNLISKYKKGLYREMTDVIRHFRTDSVTIRGDKPFAINLDGELRMAEEAVIRVAKEKIRFFYPKELTWQTADALAGCK